MKQKMNNQTITQKQVISELTAMAKEIYIAQTVEKEDGFEIQFLNGQSFHVTVKENS